MDSIRTIRECLHDLQHTDIDPDERRERYDRAHVALDALDMQRERIAEAAMNGAEVIDEIPYFNGVKVVAAYQKFHQFWMSQLTSEDMTYMRRVVGLPEPEKANPAENDGDAQPHRPDSNQTTPQV